MVLQVIHAYPICSHLQLPSRVLMAGNQWYWSLTVPFPAGSAADLRSLARSSGVQHLSGLSCAPREGSGCLDVDANPTMNMSKRSICQSKTIRYRPSLNHKPCQLKIGGRYLHDSESSGKMGFFPVYKASRRVKAFRKMRNAETPLSRGQDGLPVD